MGHYSVRGFVSLEYCSQVCWHACIVPDTYKVEAGGLFDPGRSVARLGNTIRKNKSNVWIKTYAQSAEHLHRRALLSKLADSSGAEAGILAEPI